MGGSRGGPATSGRVCGGGVRGRRHNCGAGFQPACAAWKGCTTTSGHGVQRGEGGFVAEGPPELFVVVEGAEDGVLGGEEGEHEVAAQEHFEEALGEVFEVVGLGGGELDGGG